MQAEPDYSLYTGNSKNIQLFTGRGGGGGGGGALNMLTKVYKYFL